MTLRRRLASMYASGELAALVRQHKTTRAVAAVFGVERKALCSLLDRMRAAGELPGWDALAHDSPPAHEIPNAGTDVPKLGNIGKPDKWPSVAAFDAVQPAVPRGHIIKGVSTLVDPDGFVKQQWIKTTQQDDERAQWLEAMRDMGGDLPRAEATQTHDAHADDLLTVYPVGDPHIGLLAWHEDAGENFDMNIAEENLCAAFEKLTDLAPPSAEALVIYIGDNAHADSQGNTTTKGTRVDADGRTVKMARRIVRTIRANVTAVLAKHQRVRLVVERGNHDELISALLALALSLHYENDPRVSVDTSPEMYHWFRFGRVLIGTHHGDKAKPMDLLGVMAVDRQDDWSETKCRRFYCGHYHHLMTKEVPGLVIEYLPTLAGSDAWHRAMGYRSQRAMYMDVYRRDGRHETRHYVGIEQLR